MSELISIVIPVYNAEKYIQRCLDSLLGQSYKDIEILLVNDASSDGSKEVCERYAALDSRVRLFNKDNEGAGIARNYGISKANGSYIGFCDADDYVEPDMYERLANALLDNDCDIAYCLNTNETKTPKITGDREVFSDDKIWKLMLGLVGTQPDKKEEVLYGSSVWRGLYKKKIIAENGISFLSERKVGSEDLLFNLEYLSHCKKAVYLYDELYHHCDNFESMTHSSTHFVIQNEIDLYDKVSDILRGVQRGEYQLEVDRLLIKRIRLALIRIGKAATLSNILYSSRMAKDILKNERVGFVLKGYPGHKLPIKQAVMFYFMKYRMGLVCTVLGKVS